MADEIIGSAQVNITGDYSDLKQAIDEAASEAASGAEKIAGAFEALVGIGEALAITESLKEFGTEALNAYATVQSVTVGLTQLTGSATTAGEVIENIKNIAATEPFAFPELAPTVQRMVALGVSAEQIPLVLQSAANAAAATGNSLDAIANSIDRLALSGNAGARQLTQLGLSTEQLAQVMGVSASQVKAAFLAMDESQRLDVLTTALEKFAGAATAQAQTVKGAWQILQNQFEEVMVGVGEALAPAVSDLIKFGMEAVHAAQVAIDAFNSLPEPVKEFAGAVAIAAASLAPLTVAVGTLGLGITGIQAALGPLTELLGVFGTEAGVAAEAEATVAAEAGAVAEGVGAAGIALGAVEVVVGAVGAAMVAMNLKEQIADWEGIYETLKNNTDVFFSLETGIADVSKALIDAAGRTAGFQNAWQSFVGFVKSTPIQDYLGGPLRTATDALGGLNTGLQVTAGELPAADAMARQAAQGMQQLADKTAAAAAQGQIHRDKLTGVQLALNNLGKTTADNVAQVDFWSNAVKQAAAQLDGTSQKADVYYAALQKLDQAQKTLNAGNKDYQDTLAGVTEAYDKQQGVISTLEATQGQLLAIENRTADQENILVEVTNKLAAAKKAEAAAHQAVKDAIDPLPKAYDGLITSADALLRKEQDVTAAVGYAKAALDSLMATNDGSAEHQRAVNDALQQYVDRLKASGAALTDQVTLTVNGVQVITTLGNAIDDAKKSQGDWNSVIVNGVSILRDHAAATQAATQAVTSHGAAAQSTAVIIGNLSTAVRGYVDDTTKAVNENSSLAAQFTNVSDAASGAVNYLDKSAASVSQLGADASGNVDNMSRFANSINGVTNAVGAMSQALDNADRSMNAFASGSEETLGSTNASALSAWSISAQLSGATAFAGSGVNFAAGQQSAIDEWSQSVQAAGVAAGVAAKQTATATAATTSHTAATVTNTTAVNSSTAAVGNLTNTIRDLNATTSSTSSGLQMVSKSADGLSATYQTVNKQVDFAAMSNTDLANALDTLNSELLNAGVVVDTTGLSAADAATKLQETVDGMNASSAAAQDFAKSTTSAASTISAAAQQVNEAAASVGNDKLSSSSTGPSQSQWVDGFGNSYASQEALNAALKANPGLAGPHTSDTGSVLPNVLYSDPTGRFGTITASPGVSLSQALAMNSAGVGSGMGSAGSFGSNPFSAIPASTGLPSSVLSNQSGLSLTMNYPQFNSSQQAQQIMSQMVTMLRTVPGLKL